MIIKQCLVTLNGITCISIQTTINEYIQGYFLFRLLEVVLVDTIGKHNDLKNFSFTNYIDF